MTRPRACSPPSLAALALAAGGCTSSGSGGEDTAGDFKGAQRDVASTVEDLQSAGSKGDEDEVCTRLLATSLVDRLKARGGCRKVVDAALKDVDTSDLKVESVADHGPTARRRRHEDRATTRTTAADRPRPPGRPTGGSAAWAASRR